MQMERRPVLLWAASSIDLPLARALRSLRTFAQGIRDILDASRNARDAEALYHELSRLCDAELEQRGSPRQHILRLVFDRLTAALVSLLLCLVVPSTAMCGPSAKEIEVNGVRLQYVEQGTGDPIVFVHGAFSDLRVWEPMREEIAKRYRFIAYSQRYFGTGPWPDDGKNFSIATDADDLAKFITALSAEPVHVVSRSRGGAVAIATVLKNPALVRSLTLHEPGLFSMLPTDSAEGKAARETHNKYVAPAVVAAKAGDSIQAVRLFFEGEYQLGPGGFERLPQAAQTMLLDNARTAPLLFGASPPPPTTCDMLKTLNQATLVTHGEKTHAHNKLINDAISKCIPRARQVSFPNLVHDAPSRDPGAFTAALLEFLSRP